MTLHKKQISKDVYERAMRNKGYITDKDEKEIFTASELYGYGVYLPMVCEENGDYYVRFKLGHSCD